MVVHGCKGCTVVNVTSSQKKSVQPVLFEDTPKPKGILDVNCCPHPPPLGTTANCHIQSNTHTKRESYQPLFSRAQWDTANLECPRTCEKFSIQSRTCYNPA